MARHQSVLIIARDGLIRKVAASGFETYGYEVMAAEDGVQAAEMLRTNRHITVLVTDADHSGPMDGLAIARLAREMNPNIDVVYTSRTPQRISLAAMVPGAPMVRDPYHPHQLIGVLSNLRQRSHDLIEPSAA
jgi:CheY-like chemotaxis protein